MTAEGFRLSPQQRRLWHDLDGHSPEAGQTGPYRSWAVVTIDGALSVERLEAAFGSLVAEHEILRTNFRCLPGVRIPLQWIGDHPLQLSREPGGEGTLEAAIARRRAGEESFDLEQGEALRAHLTELEEHHHLLEFELPALCADAATLDNLVKLLAEAYGDNAGAAEATGAAKAKDDDEEEELQYADLAEWQNQLLEDEDEEGEPGRNHWQSVTVHPAAPLPQMQPSERAFTPRSLDLKVARDLTQGIDRLLITRGFSVDAFWSACWQILLARSTDHTALTLGVAVNGRRYDEVRDAVGPLARRVPMTVQIDPSESFAARVAACEGELAEARRWQEYFNGEGTDGPVDLPYGLEILPPPPGHDAAGVHFAVARRRALDARVQLQLTCHRSASGTDLEVLYDGNRFSAAFIEDLAERLLTLAADAIERPDAALGALRLLGHRETETLFELGGGTGRPPEDLEPVPRQLERQALASPNDPALRFRGKTVTHGELRTRANRLAHHLRSLDIGPEDRVAILLQRSPELVVAVHAVLRAGAAFVALDPEDPPPRRAYRLQDALPTLLITTTEILPTDLDPALRTVILDREEGTLGQLPETPPEVPLHLDHPAYLMHTSGSTGRPKGVVVSHRALANYLGWIQGLHGLTSNDRAMLKTTVSFDVSVRELLWPTAVGATLVIAEPGGHRDVSYLARLCAEEKVTVINFVPALLDLFLATESHGDAPALRVLSGGDALSPALVQRFFEGPGTRGGKLFNQYGPTETTITATAWPCSAEDSAILPIGHPVTNARVLVVDRRLAPKPLGLVGELVVGGPGLARGYFRRPAATAAAFVPDPFSDTAGERLYKTGDQCRLRGDGAVLFAGRRDHQVKIRGVRIELGEIEAVFTHHPAVEVGVVGTHAGEGEEKSLVAWFVPTSTSADDPPSTEDLQSWLRERLPEVMVPSAFLALDALPLTGAGKVDRQALPDPGEVDFGGGREIVPPRDDVEEIVAGVWTDILPVEEVSVVDDFFALGGHSLLAMQIMTRLQESFRTSLPLHLLFQAPTVEALAREIVAAEASPGMAARLAKALKRLRDMSPEEVAALRARQGKKA